MPFDNPVIRFLNKMTDLMLLNILFVICSIPLITVGASLTAMYSVNLRSVRYGDGYVVKNFFKAFKNNFVQATACWLGILAFAVIFYIDYVFWMQNDVGVLSDVMIIALFGMMFVCLIIIIWLFPVISKMQDKLTVQVKNAAAMSVGHFFPYTVICVLIMAFVAYSVYTNVGALLIMLFVGCATVSYIFSFFFYKVFAKYITEDSLGEDDLLYGDNSEK